jgi:hypothetical protein
LAAFRLRYQAVIEQGWKRPQDFLDRLERDHFDEDAIHVVAWDSSLAVGTARLVLPKQGRKLPVEEAFDVAVEPLGKVVDCGRITVLHSYPGPRHKLFLGLLGRCWLETRASGYCEVCGSVTASAIRLYKLAANFTITPLGPPRTYWGAKRYPARFNFRPRLEGVGE